MFYKNESAIGEALQECFKQGIKREELFITTKLERTVEWFQKDKVEAGLKSCLERLKLDYVDLFLIHWSYPLIDFSVNPPVSKSPSVEGIWPSFELLVDQGLAKHIGVSNAPAAVVANLIANC